jgi:hypothetical protein
MSDVGTGILKDQDGTIVNTFVRRIGKISIERKNNDKST